MKAAPFEYALADSIEQVAQILEDGDGDAVIIAGGQSLMPMLAMRMARPSMVIDINNIAELAGIEVHDDEIVIKACTRQTTALESPIIRQHLPLLTKALGFIGHLQTRNRGTIGGSLAHADPASEIPLTALAMDVEVELHSVNGRRLVPISEFFLGPMMTSVEPNELLVSLHFPNLTGQDRVGISFHEVNERHGDFAIVAVAARIHLDGNGVCTQAAIAFGGVDACPVRVAKLEQQLVSQVIDTELLQTALQELPDFLSPSSDQHASEEYRLRVAAVLAERAILDAVGDASGDVS